MHHNNTTSRPGPDRDGFKWTGVPTRPYLAHVLDRLDELAEDWPGGVTLSQLKFFLHTRNTEKMRAALAVLVSRREVAELRGTEGAVNGRSVTRYRSADPPRPLRVKGGAR